MTENEKQIGKNTDDPNHKGPYSRPQLVVYGDIQEITLARQEGKDPDNPGRNTKTGFSGPTPKPTQPPGTAAG